jgi:hypothetical protein
MIMPAGRKEAADAAIRHVFHLDVLALQDQRHLGIETLALVGAAVRGPVRPVGDGRLQPGQRLRPGIGFGLGQFLLERGDALLVSLFHFVDLAADGGEIGRRRPARRTKRQARRPWQDGLCNMEFS